MGLPEGFILPTIGENTGQPGVLKAVAGSVGTQLATIKSVKVYNASKSDLCGQEIYDEYETALIKNDKFSTVALRVSCLNDSNRRVTSELNMRQQVQLAPLRERFREQQNSHDTILEDWEAIIEPERTQLKLVGIHFVEQLASYDDHELFKLGPNGKALRDRARRHIQGKKANDAEILREDMNLLMKEKEQESKRREELESRVFKLQEQLASLSKTPSKKSETRQPGVQE